MNNNIFKALMFSSVFTAVSANAVEVVANVSGMSNYIYRGKSYSDDAFSASTNIKTSLPFGLFVNYEGHTVKINTADLEHKLTGGFQSSIGHFKLSSGYTQTNYTGSADKILPKFYNNGEVFVSASAYGLNGLISKTVDSGVLNDHNLFGRVSYKSPSIYNSTVEVGTSFTRFKNSGNKHTATDLTLSYQALSNVKILASYSFGGKNEDNTRIDNLSSLGIVVGF
jgi:hypothetical protein